MIDAFSLSILFLGSATVYSVWKEYEFRNKGDTLKTEGPVVMRVTPVGATKQTGTLTKWADNPTQSITQPDRVRAQLNAYNQTNLGPKGRRYQTPGVDLFPGGRQVVAPNDSRNPATANSMIVKSQSMDSVANQQDPGLDHPDSDISLLYPQPTAGYISQWRSGQQTGVNMALRRDDRRNRHFHDRPDTFNPSHITTATILKEDIADPPAFPSSARNDGIRMTRGQLKTAQTYHVRQNQSSRAGAREAMYLRPVKY